VASIPDKFLALLSDRRAHAYIATVMPDGSPQVTPIWFDFTDGKIRFNTARGRVKHRNIKLGTKVALAIMDPDNPHRYIQIRGPVTKITEEGANAHIVSLAKKYWGHDQYPFQPDEVRVSYEVEPASVQTMG